MSNSYTKVNGNDAAKEYSVSAGFGLPIFRSKSMLNISGQYIKVSPKVKGMLEENSLRVNVGITFNEDWFRKYKVDETHIEIINREQLNLHTMRTKLIAPLLMLFIGVTASMAQKGVTDGSRFGHGLDSIECLKHISIYTEYVKTNNFKDAYPSWKSVFNDAPVAQVSTYTNGTKILRWFIANEKDAAKKKSYFNELMGVYDQRIKYLDVLNTYVRNPNSKGSIIITNEDLIEFIAKS